MKNIVFFIMLFVIAIHNSFARNELRCPKDFIHNGDAAAMVAERCGEPDHTYGNVWTYFLGGRAYSIRLRNGKVNNIKDVGRVD